LRSPADSGRSVRVGWVADTLILLSRDAAMEADPLTLTARRLRSPSVSTAILVPSRPWQGSSPPRARSKPMNLPFRWGHAAGATYIDDQILMAAGARRGSEPADYCGSCVVVILSSRARLGRADECQHRSDLRAGPTPLWSRDERVRPHMSETGRGCERGRRGSSWDPSSLRRPGRGRSGGSRGRRRRHGLAGVTRTPEVRAGQLPPTLRR
jgi:hypothetical protein